MRRHAWLTVPLALLLFAIPTRGAPLRLHVSPNGNDAWPGTRADRPFRTLERARDEIRKLKKEAGLP
ncbi:MAG: hypothetical protein HN904_18370, partial [Victivallales bacterium]|nr:hypothetical protein [Victivallales bacterium]